MAESKIDNFYTLYKDVCDIIFKKSVDILALKVYDNVEDYNENLIWHSQKDLTEEEFIKLKTIYGKYESK